MLVGSHVEPPAQVIALIRDNADKTPDGRRTLINPKKTLAAVQAG